MEFANTISLEDVAGLQPREKSELTAKFGEGVRLGMQNFDEHDGVCTERYLIVVGQQIQGLYQRRIYGTSHDRTHVEAQIKPHNPVKQSA